MNSANLSNVRMGSKNEDILYRSIHRVPDIKLNGIKIKYFTHKESQCFFN